MASSQLPIPQRTADDIDHAVAAELRFMAEWQNGDLPFLSAIVRVRQFRRACMSVHER